MKNPPQTAELIDRITRLIEEHLEPQKPLVARAALMAELGLDSLDLIELGFSLQETFEFEFSDKNAVEELNTVLGDDSLIAGGALTAEGREMVFRRMPELAEMDLPDTLTVAELQRFYSIETYARLIREFYLACPDVDPESGEAVVLDDLRPVLEVSRKPAPVPKGDDLVAGWVAETAASLKRV